MSSLNEFFGNPKSKLERQIEAFQGQAKESFHNGAIKSIREPIDAAIEAALEKRSVEEIVMVQGIMYLTIVNTNILLAAMKAKNVEQFAALAGKYVAEANVMLERHTEKRAEHLLPKLEKFFAGELKLEDL